MIKLTIDGRAVTVAVGDTLLDAATALDIEVPTICWAKHLTPVNACRMCVVEVQGARVLAASCARQAEEGMVVHTDSERVRTSRKVVLELLASSVDLSTAPQITTWLEAYGADADRFGPKAEPTTDRDERQTGHHHAPDGAFAATVGQPPKLDNGLFVRDYAKCVTCYKCVEACGTDAQNTFAISIAGRGFDARVSVEFAAPLNDSACVFCGNCIAVCPTGALMALSEYDLRRAGDWHEERQTTTETICPYCGVGCTLALVVQDNRIVRVDSPEDSSVTRGNLCIKGRFGTTFVHEHATKPTPRG